MVFTGGQADRSVIHKGVVLQAGSNQNISPLFLVLAQFLSGPNKIDPDGHLRFSSPSFDDQDGEDAGERRAEVDVPHLLPGHHHAARRQVPPPEGTDRDAAVGQGKKNREIYLTTELCQFLKMRSRELRFFFLHLH